MSRRGPAVKSAILPGRRPEIERVLLRFKLAD